MGHDERPAWPQLPRFTGRAWVFMHDLAAETILPARAADLPADEARRHLFGDLGADLAARVAAGDILVAGENLGHGPGAAAAAGALAAAGVSVVVARSFAAAFAEAALGAAIPALVCDAPEGIRTGHTVRVDLEASRIVDLSSGDRFPIRNLTDDLLERLRALLIRE